MKDLITTFPLGFVATITPEGAPAVSPKGTFIVLSDTRVAFADIRSPGTRKNLIANPALEVNFVDPFRRKAVRIAGKAQLHAKGSDWFSTHHPLWGEIFGTLANRIAALIEIDIESAHEIWTPPYDDGVTEEDMIATYVAKFGALHS